MQASQDYEGDSWVMIAILGNKWQHLLLTAGPEQILPCGANFSPAELILYPAVISLASVSLLSWLQDWNEHMQEAPVPLQARQICMPLTVGNWSRALNPTPFSFYLNFYSRVSHIAFVLVLISFYLSRRGAVKERCQPEGEIYQQMTSHLNYIYYVIIKSLFCIIKDVNCV